MKCVVIIAEGTEDLEDTAKNIHPQSEDIGVPQVTSAPVSKSYNFEILELSNLGRSIAMKYKMLTLRIFAQGFITMHSINPLNYLQFIFRDG